MTRSDDEAWIRRLAARTEAALDEAFASCDVLSDLATRSIASGWYAPAIAHVELQIRGMPYWWSKYIDAAGCLDSLFVARDFAEARGVIIECIRVAPFVDVATDRDVNGFFIGSRWEWKADDAVVGPCGALADGALGRPAWIDEAAVLLEGRVGDDE
jgi:hypothetical protein